MHQVIIDALPEFMTDRGVALFDSLLATSVTGILILVARKASKARFMVRYSLRARLMAALVILACICSVGICFNLNFIVLIAFSFLGFSILVWWILRDLSRVGITNAFQTTAQGISATESLKQVKHDLAFLGIGAKKLTDTPEFESMIRRCKAAGGGLKFLLSGPDNPALEIMAKRNGRNDLTYRSRVKESIREIVTRAEASGVDFEIRLYELDQEIALPHFRLMFIDQRLCIFSQLLWSANEGLDNPQLILRPNADSAESSLYQGYRKYFDDLWNLESTKKVTPELIAGWPA